METDELFEDQEEIIIYVKNALEKIQNAPKDQKERHLFDLLAHLISSSNEIAQTGDIYEAAGRLYSAAYFLEEYYSKEAREVYEKAIGYYTQYFRSLMKKGAVNEAANVALKISTIFKEKLFDQEKEAQYLEKAIGLIANQIDILHGVGTPRELAGKYQTLTMLYKQVNDWEKVLVSAESALEIAKSIKDYSVITNAYNDIAIAYGEQGEPKKAQNILYEAMDFFSKEAALYEDKQELLPLSQLYQIIKNLYGALRNPRKYKLFSRKEAGVYIAMAKLSLLYNTSNAQIASYYRGAALCYQETKQNDLDSASCFFLAGNYYLDAKKYLEAAINYEDAAKQFDLLGNFKKAYELYLKAGENAARSKSLQPAIENFMWAFDIAIENNYEYRKIVQLLNKNLGTLARIEEAAENHFVAATLQLEAANYYSYLPKSTLDGVKEYLSHSLENYWLSVANPHELEKRSLRAYAATITAVISHILENTARYIACTEILKELNSKIGAQYELLLEKLIEYITNANFDLEFEAQLEDKKLQKVYAGSEEIKILLTIIARTKDRPLI